MEINDKLIDKLADLSRLEFEGQHKEAIKKDLSKMLDFVQVLNEVDTDGVEPLIYMTEGHQQLRSDVARDEITQEQALKNAPDRDSDYIKVPKVLDN